MECTDVARCEVAMCHPHCTCPVHGTLFGGGVTGVMCKLPQLNTGTGISGTRHRHRCPEHRAAMKVVVHNSLSGTRKPRRNTGEKNGNVAR